MMRVAARIMPFRRIESAFRFRIPAVGLALAASAWLVLILLSPCLVSHNPPRSVFFRMGGLAYLAGRVVCHQRADRSFHAWGVQLPVCGRCFGLYAGAMLGSLFAACRSRRAPARDIRQDASPATPRDAWVGRFAVAAVPTAASLGLEIMRIWAQTPAVRSVAAVPLGFAVAWFVGNHSGDVLRRLRVPWRV